MQRTHLILFVFDFTAIDGLCGLLQNNRGGDRSHPEAICPLHPETKTHAGICSTFVCLNPMQWHNWAHWCVCILSTSSHSAYCVIAGHEDHQNRPLQKNELPQWGTNTVGCESQVKQHVEQTQHASLHDAKEHVANLLHKATNCCVSFYSHHLL